MHGNGTACSGFQHSGILRSNLYEPGANGSARYTEAASNIRGGSTHTPHLIPWPDPLVSNLRSESAAARSKVVVLRCRAVSHSYTEAGLQSFLFLRPSHASNPRQSSSFMRGKGSVVSYLGSKTLNLRFGCTVCRLNKNGMHSVPRRVMALLQRDRPRRRQDSAADCDCEACLQKLHQHDSCRSGADILFFWSRLLGADRVGDLPVVDQRPNKPTAKKGRIAIKFNYSVLVFPAITLFLTICSLMRKRGP